MIQGEQSPKGTQRENIWNSKVEDNTIDDLAGDKWKWDNMLLGLQTWGGFACTGAIEDGLIALKMGKGSENLISCNPPSEVHCNKISC